LPAFLDFSLAGGFFDSASPSFRCRSRSSARCYRNSRLVTLPV